MRPKKKKCYVALSRPTVKCEKTGSVFFFFFFFFFLCQIWAKNLLKFVFNGLKKHLHDLYICVLTAFRPSFPHLETKKKILENSTLSRYVKKKKKKKIPTDRPNFLILVGWGQHNNFFFLPDTDVQCQLQLPTGTINIFMHVYNFSRGWSLEHCIH